MTRKCVRPSSAAALGILLAIGIPPAASLAEEPPAARRPLFRSLSAQDDSAWIRDLNRMSEGERQKRIGNYHSSSGRRRTEPPQRVEPSAMPGTFLVPPQPNASSRRPPVVKHPFRAIVAQPPAPKPSTAVSTHAQLPPSRHAAADSVMTLTPKVRRAPKRSAPPSLGAPPSAGEKSLRTRLAYIPLRNRTAYPYAPYRNKAEYDAAVAKAAWRPGKASPNAKSDTPSTFKLASLFRRSSSDAKAAGSSSKKSKSNGTTKRSKEKAAFASSGLPQPSAGKGPVIQTTLFGS